MDLNDCPEDMSLEEKKMLIEFKKDGCPGLLQLNENTIVQFVELYMAGKTYSEIAEFTKQKKQLVLYMSSYSKWFNKRFDHYQDIAEKMIDKVKNARLDSINMLTNLVSSYSKMIDKRTTEANANNDWKALEALQKREITYYYKAVALLDKLTLETEPHRIPIKDVPNNPDVTKVQTKDEILEFPSNTDSGKILEQLVKFKRIPK